MPVLGEEMKSETLQVPPLELIPSVHAGKGKALYTEVPCREMQPTEILQTVVTLCLMLLVWYLQGRKMFRNTSGNQLFCT